MTAPLLVLACSGMKLDRPAPALQLYRGVMYQTYRANVRPDAMPQVVILSALHGFIDPGLVIDPYDQVMTQRRADTMLCCLDEYSRGAPWPASVGRVFLAGGANYRRVMLAALQARYGADVLTAIEQTSGGIGFQRAQLGQFLRSL